MNWGYYMLVSSGIATFQATLSINWCHLQVTVNPSACFAMTSPSLYACNYMIGIWKESGTILIHYPFARSIQAKNSRYQLSWFCPLLRSTGTGVLAQQIVQLRLPTDQPNWVIMDTVTFGKYALVLSSNSHLGTGNPYFPCRVASLVNSNLRQVHMVPAWVF